MCVSLSSCLFSCMRLLSFIGFICSSRRLHTRWTGDWSSDVCSSDLRSQLGRQNELAPRYGNDDAAAQHLRLLGVGSAGQAGDREAVNPHVMVFDPRAYLTIVGGHDDVLASLDHRAPPLQVFVDEEADKGSQGQGQCPDHQQTSAVHSAPSGQAKTIIPAIAVSL